MTEDVQPFPGSRSEAARMLEAMAHNCSCLYDESGVRTWTCDPHNALVREPRFVERLIEARRRLAPKGEREEG